MYIEWLKLSLSNLQVYALFALLGSYLVATVSDLRYRAAQVEFLEVWVFFAFVALIIDIFSVLIANTPLIPIAIKWSLILIFSIASHRKIGLYFRLATGDVLAVAAFSALLSVGLLIFFYIMLKIIDLILKPFLKIGGNKKSYPFMPVILLTSGVLLAVVIWLVPNL